MRFQVINQVFVDEKDISRAKILALKDFQRLEKLLGFDYPDIPLKFDYSKFNEFSLSLVVDIPAEHKNVLLSYLASNYYQVTPFGGLHDPLLRVNALSRVLKHGTELTHNSQEYTFNSFGVKYRGYLDDFPGKPGLHHDYERLLCQPKTGGDPVVLLARDLALESNPFLESQILALNPMWKRENYEATSFIGSLPPTQFFEGDVVLVQDKEHPLYSADAQCLVYRTIWNQEPLIYKIKSPTNQIFEATASQLLLKEKGVTRLYYNGNPPAYWKDLQAQAEFYLLLGFFCYLYNSNADSYQWTIDSAQKAVYAGEGHAILRWKDGIFLIKFLTDPKLGFRPADVADATLNGDMILTL